MFLQFLTADQTPKGDPFALLLVVLIAIVFLIWVLIRNAKAKKAAAVNISEAAPKEKPVTEIPKAPGSAGQLKLYNVEPKTAAMIMAIVADKMGKPLNELRFISIKEVE